MLISKNRIDCQEIKGKKWVRKNIGTSEWEEVREGKNNYKGKL